MPRQLLLVSGLCRCGSSLLMQMLDAGGYPICAGASEWPAYEHPANLGNAPLPLHGGAIKWVDPQRFEPPPRARVRGSVLLLRDNREQARSHLKFLASLGVNVRGARARELAWSLKRDEPTARVVLASRGPVIAVRFEELVSTPLAVLARLRNWLGEPIDVEAAAAALRERETGAACLPYLLEARLLQESAPLGAAGPHPDSAERAGLPPLR